MKKETRKRKKKRDIQSRLVTPTETKGPAPWRSLARPGGPLYSWLVFSTGTKGPPLVPGVKPGLKEGTFSLGLVLPVGKPGLKGFPNQKQKALLHQ